MYVYPRQVQCISWHSIAISFELRSSSKDQIWNVNMPRNAASYRPLQTEINFSQLLFSGRISGSDDIDAAEPFTINSLVYLASFFLQNLQTLTYVAC